MPCRPLGAGRRRPGSRLVESCRTSSGKTGQGLGLSSFKSASYIRSRAGGSSAAFGPAASGPIGHGACDARAENAVWMDEPEEVRAEPPTHKSSVGTDQLAYSPSNRDAEGRGGLRA